MVLRLGDLLVQHGVLTREQVEDILVEQQAVGRPFGELAERLFGVPPQAVERAWAEQYAMLTGEFDLIEACFDPEAIALISARQAWQFRVLPIRFSGDELTVCTVKDHLARALRFVGWKLEHPCHFVLAEPQHFAETLMRHYPLAGMTPGMITGRQLGAA
jgi:type IV pilus assembly protein PilB